MSKLNLSKEVLARRVFRQGMNDHLQKNTILSILHPYLSLDKLTIDVGAAAGHMTYFFAGKSKRVYSFEAVPPVYEQLKKMEDLGNVEAFHAAISDYSGKGTIFVDDKRLSNSGFLDLVGGPSIEVPVMTLDDLFQGIEQEGETVGFIKIDVEGTELDVIRGASNLITTYRPNLMVEIYKPYSKYPLDRIFDYLMTGLKYKCLYFNQKTKGVVLVTTVAEGAEAVENRHDEHDGDFLFY